MFGAISKLFKKAVAAPPPAAPTQTAAKRPATLPTAKGSSRNETPAHAGVSQPVSRPAPAGNAKDVLSIPYASIIRLIPNELWGKLAPAGAAGHQFSVSRTAVAAQLATGAVKAKFGDLRKGAPNGLFINSPAEDNRYVELPLSDILSQLHPDAYARRQDQSAPRIDQAVPDIFGANAASSPIRVMEKREVGSQTTMTRQKAPSPGRGNSGAPDSPSAPMAKAPAAPAPASAPEPAPVPLRMPAPPAASPSAAATAPIAPAPQPHPIPKTPPTGARPLPKIPAPAAPAVPQAPAAAKPTPGFTPIAPIVPLSGPLAQGSFTIELNAIAEQWPNSVRQELAQLKIPDARVALPPIEICEGLKRGRIQYPWRTLRSWIQPTPLYAAPSPNDDVMLELPLRTLTPSFLQFIRENPVNRQTAAAENITEFFRRAEQTSGVPADVLQSLLQDAPATPSFAPPPVAHAPHAAPSRPAAAPAASPTSTGNVVIENNLFCLPVSLVAGSWPEPIQQDIAQFSLGAARLDIPIDVLDAGIRSGRIEFAWSELCAWLNPPSKPAQISINGEQRVSLPIQLVGPLFIKLRPAAKARKTAVATDIPDLFNAAGVPQAVPAPETAPAPAPAPAARATPGRAAAPAPAASPAPAAPAPKPAPTNLSELFGEPTKKSWTPNEIVQRSTQLPGVAGALIALQDGLLVASSLPATLKIEMIAAFVPQIFGRLNQYSKELSLGDASATSFTIAAGTIQIYNAGLIYFAALSKPGTDLPLADLKLIASELSRHTK